LFGEERYLLWRREEEWETKRNSLLLIDLFVYWGYGHRMGAIGSLICTSHIQRSGTSREMNEREREGKTNLYINLLPPLLLMRQLRDQCINA
jgi:hypothetical protein